MAKIGFVGLGHMGLPMACNLVKAGHEVWGFDLQPQALDAFVKAGGHKAQNLEEVVQGRDMFLTMLQTGQQVQQVCLGPEGLFHYARPGQTYIDCSSIDVLSSRTVHEQAKKNGLHVVDAPVSGGVGGAQAGTLTFMVGGEADDFEKALPYLQSMGKKIISTGQAGSGQAAKMCNNMILGISMTAISEAFVLAKALGLSPEKLHEVVVNSSGQCWAMSQYVPVPGILDNVPANRGYQPGFTAQMMLKDLQLSQQSAAAVNVSTPLGQDAEQLYEQLVAQGQGQLDFSAIIELIAQQKRS